MAFTAEEEKAIEELAEMEGRSVAEVKRELLRAKLGLSSAPPRSEEASLVRTVGTGDASGAALAHSRREALAAHNARSFPGSPVVRYDRDDHETPEQAEERWLEEEAELPDGVHGFGGQTAGGIFGDGPIATSVYDPGAMARGDSRMSHMAGVKLLGLVERLEQRLSAPAQTPGRLSGGPGRARLDGPKKQLGRGSR